MTPLSIADVTIDDDFWNERLEANRERTLEFAYRKLVETGRIENFENAAEGTGDFSGRVFNDSDVYKWIEAASYVLTSVDDETLETRVDDLVEKVAAAQEDDGYLNTYFTLEEPEERWTNLGMMHELYCAGHLLEAAVAHHEATGKTSLLNVATDFADHIDDVFGPDGRGGVPGHEEIELALVRLYRTTDERRYLSLAKHFVERRGHSNSRLEWELDHLDEIAGHDRTDRHYRELYADEDGNYDGEYGQDHAPIREQEAVEGHSVRATYFYTGATMLAAELGDGSLRDALEDLWTNMTGRRMYVTGGIGSDYANEGFSRDYDLPNHVGYAETCAAVGNVFWNHQLAQATGDGRYVDTLERVLYNGFLSGVGLDGERFFYANPLRSNGEEHPLRSVDPARFSLTRKEWFETACCPPNAARLLASLERYVYGTSERDLWVNLFVGSEGTCTVAGTTVSFEQDTEYPWKGEAELTVHPEEPTDFGIRIRVPDWATDVDIRCDGEAEATREDGFLRLERVWSAGDAIEIDFGLNARQIEAHPAVQRDAGRVALERGPLVYCVEAVDNDIAPHRLRLEPDTNLSAKYDPDLLNGVGVLTGRAKASSASGWDEATLYRRRTDDLERTRFSAIPYHLWANRGQTEMEIWLNRA